MTIYFDEYFAGGTSQQIASAEKLIIEDTMNLDVTTSMLSLGGGSRRTTITASPGKNGRLQIEGFKNRDGSGVKPDFLNFMGNSGQKPSISIDQAMTIITSLVWMLGGAVHISSEELVGANHSRYLTAYQKLDPYALQLVVQENS